MGMYTELIFGATLKEDTPKEIIDTIEWMINPDKDENNQPSNLPKGDRISYMFNSGGSYYFGSISGETQFEYDDITKCRKLNTRFNIKNYNNEIESFLEWIKPYIESGSGANDFYAIVTYEEDIEPTIYYLHE